MTVGFGATAGAGIVVVPASTLTIVKTVSVPVPEGTTFTVSIDCNISIIENRLSGTDHETVDGGATSTTYECDGEATALPGAAVPALPLPICPDAGPTTDHPIRVNKSYPAMTATVTVNNSLVEPPTTTTTTAPAPKPTAAPAVVAKANFTG